MMASLLFAGCAGLCVFPSESDAELWLLLFRSARALLLFAPKYLLFPSHIVLTILARGTNVVRTAVYDLYRRTGDGEEGKNCRNNCGKQNVKSYKCVGELTPQIVEISSDMSWG